MKQHREHRLGVSHTTLVHRHLKLDTKDLSAIKASVAEIDELYGMDSVSFDEKKRKLHLAYDALRLCINCVEEILEKHAVEISHDWWNRFKEEHYQFVDQNVKDNARKEPWKCH
tara:strand:+ start:2258 stop:2599 length:342 start_codon:yes stop_codon:yes gene_type:complete